MLLDSKENYPWFYQPVFLSILINAKIYLIVHEIYELRKTYPIKRLINLY